jgi:hypothetical protein
MVDNYAMQSIYALVDRKPKAFPITPQAIWLRRLMQSFPAILAINWCFQGMRGMDGRELRFRLASETALMIILALLLTRMGLGELAAIAAAAIIAHSLYFLFNGQLWVCARYCAAYRRDPKALDRFLIRTSEKLCRLEWLDEALCIGSQGAGLGTRTSRSDIDLRLIFPSGLLNTLRVNLLLLQLRVEALASMIPLDLYAYDRPESLLRFNQTEPLLVILDRKSRLAHLFGHRAIVTVR